MLHLKKMIKLLLERTKCIINGIISEEDYYDENNKHYKKIVNILINKN